MDYRSVIFDLDGTLTDSGEGIMNSAAFAFHELNLEIPPADSLRKMVGPPLAEGFSSLGVPEPLIEDAIRLYREKYNNRGGKYENRVYPGIEKMLADLKAAGFQLYVGTSKPEQLACEITALFRLDKYFERIAGATLDHSRESKADVLKYLLDAIEDAGNCVMVGDTHFDILGAHELGIPCIGVTWGYGERDIMLKAGADFLADSPEQLYSALVHGTEVSE